LRKLAREFVVAYDDDLSVGPRKMHGGNSVGRDEDSVLTRRPGQGV